MEADVFCAACGGSRLHQRVAPQEHEVKGRRIEIENDRHLFCPDCGAVSYQGDMLDAVGAAIAAEIRRQDGLLSPEEIRVVRLKYGFTQSEMEKLLGLGPKTWVRWERGRVCQSRAADQIIRALANNPRLVRDLMAGCGLEKEQALKILDTMDQAIAERLKQTLKRDLPDIGDSTISRVAESVVRELLSDGNGADIRRIA